MNREAIRKLAFFCKRALALSGYVAILADFSTVAQFISSLSKAGFSVMPHLFVIVYKPESVSKMRSRGIILEDVTQFAMIARAPRIHTDLNGAIADSGNGG